MSDNDNHGFDTSTGASGESVFVWFKLELRLLIDQVAA